MATILPCHWTKSSFLDPVCWHIHSAHTHILHVYHTYTHSHTFYLSDLPVFPMSLSSHTPLVPLPPPIFPSVSLSLSGFYIMFFPLSSARRSLLLWLFPVSCHLTLWGNLATSGVTRSVFHWRVLMLQYTYKHMARLHTQTHTDTACVKSSCQIAVI